MNSSRKKRGKKRRKNKRDSRCIVCCGLAWGLCSTCGGNTGDAAAMGWSSTIWHVLPSINAGRTSWRVACKQNRSERDCSVIAQYNALINYVLGQFVQLASQQAAVAKSRAPSWLLPCRHCPQDSITHPHIIPHPATHTACLNRLISPHRGIHTKRPIAHSLKHLSTQRACNITLSEKDDCAPKYQGHWAEAKGADKDGPVGRREEQSQRFVAKPLMLSMHSLSQCSPSMTMK